MLWAPRVLADMKAADKLRSLGTWRIGFALVELLAL
jgi:hypothetical protein